MADPFFYYPVISDENNNYINVSSEEVILENNNTTGNWDISTDNNINVSGGNGNDIYYVNRNSHLEIKFDSTLNDGNGDYVYTFKDIVINEKPDEGIDTVKSIISVNKLQHNVENLILTNWNDPIKMDLYDNFNYKTETYNIYGQPTIFELDYDELGDYKRNGKSFMGTCALVSALNIVRSAQVDRYLLERSIVEIADIHNLCLNDTTKLPNAKLGYAHVWNLETLLEYYGIYSTGYLYPAKILADLVNNGYGVIVNAGVHTIAVTGTVYNNNKKLVGYYTSDSLGGKPRIYSLDKFIDDFGMICTCLVTDYPIKTEEKFLESIGNELTGVGNELNNIIIGNDIKNTLDGYGGYNIILGKEGNDTLIAGFETLATKINGQSEIIYTPNGIKTKKEDIERMIPDILNENDTTLFDKANAALHDVLDSSQINYLNGGTGDYVDTYAAADGNNILVDEGNGSSVDSYQFFTNQLSSGTTLISDKDQRGKIYVDDKKLEFGFSSQNEKTKVLKENTEYQSQGTLKGKVFYKIEGNDLHILIKRDGNIIHTIIVPDSVTVTQKTASLNTITAFAALDFEPTVDDIVYNNFGLILYNKPDEEEEVEDDLCKVQDSVGEDDPLILDLDGDGIATTTSENGVYFDMNADGFAEHTSWAGYGDGLLAIDLDENGTIDNGREIFGDQMLLPGGELAQNGFEALAQYDENNDYVIDSNDSVFSNLAA